MSVLFILYFGAKLRKLIRLSFPSDTRRANDLRRKELLARGYLENKRNTRGRRVSRAMFCLYVNDELRTVASGGRPFADPAPLFSSPSKDDRPNDRRVITFREDAALF